MKLFSLKDKKPLFAL